MTDRNLTIYPELEQRSQEWLDLRCGLLTASSIGALIERKQRDGSGYICSDCGATPGEPCVSKARKEPTPLKGVHSARTEKAAAAAISDLRVADNDTSRALTLNLAAERITGHVITQPINRDMWRGIEEEPLARTVYSEHYGVDVQEVGFMIRDEGGTTIGYSPDGLVGNHGLIEVKSRLPKKHISTVLADAVPPENMAQIQAGLWVSGRQWCDYISYCGGMRMWVTRVHPSREWFRVIEMAAAVLESNVAEIIAAFESATVGLPMTQRLPEYDEITV